MEACGEKVEEEEEEEEVVCVFRDKKVITTLTKEKSSFIFCKARGEKGKKLKLRSNY